MGKHTIFWWPISGPQDEFGVLVYNFFSNGLHVTRRHFCCLKSIKFVWRSLPLIIKGSRGQGVQGSRDNLTKKITLLATLISYCQERHGAGSKTNQSMEQRAWGTTDCGLRNAPACRQAGSAESEKIESQAEIMEKMRGWGDKVSWPVLDLTDIVKISLVYKLLSWSAFELTDSVKITLPTTYKSGVVSWSWWWRLPKETNKKGRAEATLPFLSLN